MTNLLKFKLVKKSTDIFFNRNTEEGNPETCQLCQAKEIRTRLHEDPICWATYCDTCPGNQIMVVLKKHYRVATPEEEQHMMRVGLFLSTAQGIGSVIPSDPNSIPDHFHMHFRPDKLK